MDETIAAPRERRSASWLRFARAHALLAGVVVLLSLGAYVRLSGLDDALVSSFHSTRQYHCAIIARAMFYGLTRPVDDPQRYVAEQASARRGRLEPPMVQALAALGYVAVGREHMAVPRLVGILSWLIAGGLLFLLARRLALGAAALIAVGYWLLVPFGVVASQSFQPDPWMMLWMLMSWLAIVRNDRAPSRMAAVWVGIVSGLAVLVKPVCGFSVALLYVVLAAWRASEDGKPRPLAFLRSGEPYRVALLAAAPSALWYLPEILGGGRLGNQAEQSYRPELFRTPEYWHGWLSKLLEVAPGPYVLGLALLGLVVAPAGRLRITLWTLWLSYVAYGLTFNYHISTHDYYQLPVLPIIALSLAALTERLSMLPFPRLKLPVQIGTTSVAIAAAVLGVREIRESAWPRTHSLPDPDVRGYREIGELVKHSSKVVFLTPNSYGGPLEYRGELSGWYWPCDADIRRARRRKRPPFDWQAKFAERSHEGAEYFVSTPADELTKQRALGAMLKKQFKLISSSDKYLIYDLRAPL